MARRVVTAEALACQLRGRRTGARPPEVDLARTLLRQPFTAAVQAEGGDSRVVTFVVATDQRNRNGWKLNPNGWLLDNYERNPVVLWAHDEGSLPVGRATRTWVESKKLKAKIEFTPEGMSRFNDTLFEMVTDGYLNAVSAGFSVNEWEWVEDASGQYQLDFLEQELWEISIVPVPAEPAALKMAAATGGVPDHRVAAAMRRLELAALERPVRGSHAWRRQQLAGLGASRRGSTWRVI